MAFVLADRVRETSTTEGTSTYALGGAAAGFRTFASGIGANSTTYVATSGSQWEVGIGTVSGASLSRDTILASSNSGNRVSWGVGTKDIRCDAAANSLSQMLLGSVRWSGTSSGTNTLVVSPNPALHSYTTGMTLAFIAGGTNTGAATINAGPGAISLQRQNGVALQSGDIAGGNLYFVVLTSSSAARLLNPQVVAAPGGGGGGAVTSVFDRTGAVQAASGDYNAGLIPETSSRLWFTSSERTKLNSGVVTSFKSRAGAVDPAAGDYTAAQISETASFKVMTNAERVKLQGLPSDILQTEVQGPFSPGGSSLTFGSIPSTARSLTVLINQVGITDVGSLQIRLGDAGGIETAGYSGLMAELTTSGVQLTPNSDEEGWLISIQTAAVAAQGYCRISRVGSSNRWIGSSQVSSGGSKMCVATVVTELSQTLSQLQVRTTVGGFDEGTLALIIEG